MLKQPAHLLALSWLPFAFMTGWVFFALGGFVVGEVVLLALVSRLPAYRSWVDDGLLARTRAAAAAERQRLLSQMTNAHRLELLHLETLADAARERVTPGAMIPLEADCFGTDSLLAMFVRAAIAYCRGFSTLGASSHEGFLCEMRELAHAVAVGRTASSRAVAAHRLEIARMRAQRWETSKDDLEVLAGQLALIGEIVRLTYEHAGAPARSDALEGELAHSLANASESERTVYELTSLLATDICPDASLLRMGRVPAANKRVGVRVAAGIANTADAAAPLQLAMTEPEPDVSTPLRKAVCCAQKA